MSLFWNFMTYELINPSFKNKVYFLYFYYYIFLFFNISVREMFLLNPKEKKQSRGDHLQPGFPARGPQLHL